MAGHSRIGPRSDKSQPASPCHGRPHPTPPPLRPRPICARPALPPTEVAPTPFPQSVTGTIGLRGSGEEVIRDRGATVDRWG